jgi:hypothetical protein
VALEDKRLDDLIRLAGETEPASFDPPSAEIVDRYLLGTASSGERDAVRDAIEKSPAFRRLLREKAEDVDRAVDAAPSAPFVRKPLTGNLSTTGWLRRVTRPWIVIPVAATAIVALAFLMRSAKQVARKAPTWENVSSQLPLESLLSLNMRAGTSDSLMGYPTAEKAALGALRQLLEFRDGEFYPKPPQSTSQHADSNRNLRASLTVAGQATPIEIQGNLPGGISIPGATVTTWILRMPQRELRDAVMNDSVIKAALDLKPGEFVGVVWTYEFDGQYYSVPGGTAGPFR